MAEIRPAVSRFVIRASPESRLLDVQYRAGWDFARGKRAGFPRLRQAGGAPRNAREGEGRQPSPFAAAVHDGRQLSGKTKVDSSGSCRPAETPPTRLGDRMKSRFYFGRLRDVLPSSCRRGPYRGNLSHKRDPLAVTRVV